MPRHCQIGPASQLRASAGMVLLVLGSACTPPAPQPPPDTRAADAAAIRQADSAGSARSLAHDLDGVVSIYADDAFVFPTDAPIANTKDQIRAAWASALTPNSALSWKATKVDVARSGDMAYVIGTEAFTTTDSKGAPTSGHGKYVEVWKKQADGTWKVVADIGNDDAPEPPPAKKM